MKNTYRYASERFVQAQNVFRQFSKWIVVACGLWFISLGRYLMLVRPPVTNVDRLK